MTLHQKYFADTLMIPMPDLEVEVMLLHFQIFFIVKTSRYAIKYENEHKELNFLDVTLKNSLNQSYDFAVFFFYLFTASLCAAVNTLQPIYYNYKIYCFLIDVVHHTLSC